MKKSTFVTFCILLIFAIMQFHAYIRGRFNGVATLRTEVAQLRSEIESEKLKVALANYTLSEFRQSVATILPTAIKDEKKHEPSYQLRSLASVVSAPDGDFLQIERASGLFERAKNDFRDNKFKSSNELLNKLIAEYPDSVHLPEAHFLLAEGQFKLKEFDQCVENVEIMVSLFPESDLTGFALLRLGQVYESRDRREDAVEIYRTVLASYSEQPLLLQARENLRAAEL